ncbi:MAG TPA: nucleoside 2-deoxyribosyltransferase [Spirochaetota bacterium]|nr:nucleoside 2-deoxyribosyltransferase [Spirochaetota bacterium]
MTIYLASPLGFSEPGRNYLYGKIIPSLTAAGHSIIDPWTLTDPEYIGAAERETDRDKRIGLFRKANAVIAKNNAEAIQRCEALVACLDGTDVDSGTSAEIGYACALGKRIEGFRTDFRLSSDNEGSAVNLQVEYFILSSGGAVSRSIDEVIIRLDEKHG